jgi:hypothetical protein
MRFGRRVSYLALAFYILFHSILPAVWGFRAKSSDPLILWAFGAIRASSSPPKVEPVATTMALCSGDKLKMMVQIRRKCFVYFIHRDSQGNLAMLFPHSLKQFDIDYRIGNNYYSPRGDAWFQLDGKTGNETFYLIASDQRLLDVEYILEKYADSDEAAKQDLALQLISELDRIAEEYPAAARGAEKLAGVKGAVPRGFERAEGSDPSDIAGLASEISFDHVYSKTFVIDHK